MIKEEFFKSAQSFQSTGQHTSGMWDDIVKKYSARSRHYHTLTHLESLTAELMPVQKFFNDWNVVVFSIVYHDFIYKASKSNNEEKSADEAVALLSGIAVPNVAVSRCKQFILATKRHEPIDEETDLFTDADLSILGSDPSNYRIYTQQIRKEYSIYPDLLYRPGRKKVLLHFLEMPSIYKTKYFKDLYEDRARENMLCELDAL